MAEEGELEGGEVRRIDETGAADGQGPLRLAPFSAAGETVGETEVTSRRQREGAHRPLHSCIKVVDLQITEVPL